MRRFLPFLVLISTLVVHSAHGNAQSTTPGRSGTPSFEGGNGPLVAIDYAHKNAERSSVRGLEELLRNDGYRLHTLTGTMSAVSLQSVAVLVIINPGGWEGPSASLNDKEVAAVMGWVRAGGSLLLVIDHMPGPRNAARLIEALGVSNWHDGYAMVPVKDAPALGNVIFWRSGALPKGSPMVGPTGPAGGTGYQGDDAILSTHIITDGRAGDAVQRVATFVGSAFQAPRDADALLTMPGRAISFTPRAIPGAVPVFGTDTPQTPVGGWLQGAVLTLGSGRVALFGETGLFSGGPAADNRQFVLNLFRWLIKHP